MDGPFIFNESLEWYDGPEVFEAIGPNGSYVAYRTEETSDGDLYHMFKCTPEDIAAFKEDHDLEKLINKNESTKWFTVKISTTQELEVVGVTPGNIKGQAFIERLDFSAHHTYDSLRSELASLSDSDFGDLILRAVKDKLLLVSGDKIFRISRKDTHA